MDTAVNEALRAPNSANVRRYTELQCRKARRRRLKADQRLVRVLVGNPDIVCGTNTKGEVCLSVGSCTALSAPLGGPVAFTTQEHEADVWVNVSGGAKYASKVKLWASWFCMDGGDEQALLRSLDISANLNQHMREVEEDIGLFLKPIFDLHCYFDR